MNLAPLIVLGGVVGAVVLSSPKKKRRKKSAGGVVVIDDEPDVDVVPAPVDAIVVLAGSQGAPNLGDASVDWWIGKHEGMFGWQYINNADGSSVMSYLDGVIYHYRSDEEALADLQTVLG